MEMRRLGRTGLDVPVVGMGTWRTFDVSHQGLEDACCTVVDGALASGSTFFDSSPMYGHAERVLGKALSQRRNAATIATKVWASSASEGRAQADRALKYFGGIVDLYQVHNLVAAEQQLPLLERLLQEQKIRAIGITQYDPEAFDEMIPFMQSGRITAVQVPYNPVEVDIEKDILPRAADLGIGVIVMRPFGEGALLKKAPRVTELMPLRDFGIETWAQALLKWILSDERCHVAIPATSRPDRVRENAMAGNPPWFGPDERAWVARLAMRIT